MPPRSDEEFRERERRWLGLRSFHSATRAQSTRHQNTSIESVLWEISSRHPERTKDPRYEIGVKITYFVSAVLNAYGFRNAPKLERELTALCRSYSEDEAQDDGLVDWREMLCALHAMNNTGHCYNHPMKILQHFFSVYALPNYAHVVARKDLLALISIAAVTKTEMDDTRHALDARLGQNGPEDDRFVSFSKFREVVQAESRGILHAFKNQIWCRLSSVQKLTYLKIEQEISCQRFEKYMYGYNMAKAARLLKNNELARSYQRWSRFTKKQLVIKQHAARMSKRRCRGIVRFWQSWACQRRPRVRRRQIALVLGQKSVMRRIFVSRWRRWVKCEQRIRAAVGVPENVRKRVNHGAWYLRSAIKFVSLRRAIRHWHEKALGIRRWETACGVAIRLTKAWNFRAWKNYYVQKREERLLEQDCERRQAYLQQLLADAEQTRIESEAQEAARREAAERVEEERKSAEREERIAWERRRREADRAFQDRLTAEIQLEQRAKKVALDKKEKEEAFAKKWDRLELERVEDERRLTAEWLESKSSKNTILKEYKRIRREFYQPPTPRSMDREAKLKSLASIVLIRIEGILFQQHLLLQDIIHQYDNNSRGYLSHEEFKRLIKDLPVDLSPEQVRQIIREIDADNDGYIDLAELENALEVVHRYNGPAASPWRQYIDPAQDVMCYTNITTDESILEHRMTNRKLMEITRANYIAEAELAAIRKVRHDRAEAWEAEVSNDAAATIQRMYKRFQSRQELDRLHWKIRAKVRKDREIRREKATRKIQHWYRKHLAQWIYKLAVCLHVEAIPDFRDRRLYYFNHMSGSCSWEPPRRAKVYDPQDFVGTGPYVQWNVPHGQPLRRLFQKPPGYPRCTRCLQSLALLRCDILPGSVYCFGCFRETVDVDLLRTGNAHITRVSPTECSFCHQKIAAWRCAVDTAEKLVGRPACDKCQQRIHDSGTRFEWIRL